MSTLNYNLTSNNRFKLIFGGDRHIGNPFELMCSGVTLPGMSGGVTELGAPMRPLPQPGGSVMFDDLYVNFVVSEDLREWIYIFKWIREINAASKTGMLPYYSTVELIILTNKFNPLLSFTYHNCFPYILGVVDFNTDSVAAETLTSNASFKFSDYTLNTNL